MNFLFRIIFNTFAIAFVFWAIEHYLLPGQFGIKGGLIGYLFVSLFFGVFQTFLKPFIKILTIPIHFLSLGLSSLVISGGLLWLIQHMIDTLEVPDISIFVSDSLIYIAVGLILSFVTGFLHWLEKK